MPRTDLKKVLDCANNTGAKYCCLDELKTDLSSLGHILQELTKEVFGNLTRTCPFCGAPMFPKKVSPYAFIKPYNFISDKIEYSNISKYFSHYIECSNTKCACSDSYGKFDLLLKEEFFPFSEINRNKLSSQTQTFGLPTAFLSLPMNDEYILQDVLIMLKDAGYTKVFFGIPTDNNTHERMKFPDFHSSLNFPENTQQNYFISKYRYQYPEVMKITAFKPKNRDCMYDNQCTTMLKYIFFNTLHMYNINFNISNTFANIKRQYESYIIEHFINPKKQEPTRHITFSIDRYSDIKVNKSGFLFPISEGFKTSSENIDSLKSLHKDLRTATKHQYIATYYLGRSVSNRDYYLSQIAYAILILCGLEVDLTK